MKAFVVMMIAYPLLAYVMILLLFNVIMKRGRRRGILAAEWTTPFLLLNIHFTVVATWHTSLWLYFIFVWALGLVVHFIIAARKDDEWQLLRSWRQYWRFTFVVALLGYFGVLIGGLAYVLRVTM